MGLFRLIITALFIWLAIKLLIKAYYVFKFVKKFKNSFKQPEQSNEPKPQEKIVACYKCKLYLPETESILKNGKRYCCPEHAK